MDNILISILLVILGLIFGVISVFIINHIRKNNTSKSISDMLDKAKEDAEKIKKDYLLEGKEEIRILKDECEKEIREKKNEIKASKQIKQNDIITIRGKGRFIIKEFTGTTRSGRTVILVEKYIWLLL